MPAHLCTKVLQANCIRNGTAALPLDAYFEGAQHQPVQRATLICGLCIRSAAQQVVTCCCAGLLPVWLQITNTATLTAGKAGQDQRTYKADASATLTVVDCDVKPAFTVDQPNLQTSLTYAWSQTLAPLSAASVQVPWGGGSSVPAQATFTRTVTSATFQASFTLTITNPAAAPIALANLQLACPWGGNIMLPCGSAVGATGTFGTTNNWLVIPASGSINCMVNMLPMAATWGADFTQPCTIISSSWLGTQTTFQGLVLNFAAPQRWQTINNCALWSVTCSAVAGNPFYLPAVGGLPAGQQVCGSEQSNAPLPPQPFTVSFSGGWVGDGTQPGACSSSVTVRPLLCLRWQTAKQSVVLSEKVVMRQQFRPAMRMLRPASCAGLTACCLQDNMTLFAVSLIYQR